MILTTNFLLIPPLPSLKLLPGSKLLLGGKVQVVDSNALLSKDSCKVLGGCVSKLADDHTLKKVCGGVLENKKLFCHFHFCL